MKRTYIQPQIILVQVELDNVICISPGQMTTNGEKADTPMGGTTLLYDAPRTRLWGNDED